MGVKPSETWQQVAEPKSSEDSRARKSGLDLEGGSLWVRGLHAGELGCQHHCGCIDRGVSGGMDDTVRKGWQLGQYEVRERGREAEKQER